MDGEVGQSAEDGGDELVVSQTCDEGQFRQGGDLSDADGGSHEDREGHKDVGLVVHLSP